MAQGKMPKTLEGKWTISGWQDEPQTINMLQQIFGDTKFLDDAHTAAIANMLGDIILDPTTWIGVGASIKAAKEAKLLREAEGLNDGLKEMEEMQAAEDTGKSAKEIKSAQDAESDMIKTGREGGLNLVKGTSGKTADIMDYMGFDDSPEFSADDITDIPRLDRYVDQSKLARVTATLSEASSLEKADELGGAVEAAGGVADAAEAEKLASTENVLTDSFKLKFGNNSEKILGSDAREIRLSLRKLTKN